MNVDQVNQDQNDEIKDENIAENPETMEEDPFNNIQNEVVDDEDKSIKDLEQNKEEVLDDIQLTNSKEILEKQDGSLADNNGQNIAVEENKVFL